MTTPISLSSLLSKKQKQSTVDLEITKGLDSGQFLLAFTRFLIYFTILLITGVKNIVRYIGGFVRKSFVISRFHCEKLLIQ